MRTNCASCGSPLPETARFCPACAAPVEAEPEARERKLATILFADLVGSTELGGSLDPEHTRDLLDRFYDAMASEIALGGGTVEKFIGDAVVAVYGAPAAQEDHAERALQVALWMRERLAELFGHRLALRIGVNSGEVVVGKPREGSSFATGDPVNIAARLEQAARPGQVLVGHRTALFVGGAFEFRESTTVQAKGKPDGIACRELVRMIAQRRPRGGLGLATTFVGRAGELSWVRDELERATIERRPRLVTLVGDPGVGKTSLVREFRGRLPENVSFRLGRCLPYGRSVTYSPLADVLRAELGLRQEDPPETVLARLVGHELLGLTLGLDVAGDLDPRSAGLRLQEEWVGLVSELAAERPLVLAVEDLHWAAEPLLDLLELVLSAVEGPLVLLATTRPGRPGLAPAGAARVLQPLTDEEVQEMLDRVLGGPLQASARELVVRHAEGNPFFLEELLSSLLDRHLLERRNGGWSLIDSHADLGIPDSVQGVLAARIDLLPPPAKEALQAAAVIGRSFTAAGLAALVGSAAEARTLVERGFCRPTEPELVFKHALTRDVAYGSLPKARRALMHASFAAWLEQEDPGDVRAGTLAYHYAEAVDPEIVDLAWRGREQYAEQLRAAALRWLRRAAQLAVGRFDLDDALALLHRAAELNPNDAALWREIGRACALKFDGEAYWTAMLKAVELTSEPSILGEIYAELAFESSMRGGMWKRSPDHALVEGWLERALELAAPAGSSRARALVTKALRTDDIEVADQAVALAEQLDDAELVSYAYFARSGASFVVSDYHAAYDWARRRIALVDRLGDPDKIAHIHHYGASAALAVGRLEEAETLARRHDAIASRLSPHHEVHALGVLLMIEEALAHWDAIRHLQARTERAIADNAGTPCALSPRALLSCAIASAELGLDAETRRLEGSVAALGFEGYGQYLDAPPAHLALLRGDLDQARALLDESGHTWLLTMDSSLFGGATLLDALVRLGRKDEAEREATRLAQSGTYLEPFALRTLGLVRGDPALIARSIELFETMGLDWHAARTRERAAQLNQDLGAAGRFRAP
jgi:class 3 adenylate cyclase/tetratricopeptide (TPR) repeat protein